MNTSFIESPEVIYKPNVRTLENDKDYFAAYLNMARHNAFITLSHITQVLGKNPSGEDQLANMYAVEVFKNGEGELPENIVKAKKLIDKHFPFIKHLVNENDNVDKAIAKKYYEALRLMFSLLNKYRNFYSHSICKEKVSFDNGLRLNLETIYKSSIEEVVKRFKLQEEEVAHLKSNSENKDFYYSFIRKNNPPDFSEKGIAFFICLFLEKKYAFLFLKHLKGFKKDDTPSFRASLESFCVLRIRIPKLRIDAEKDLEMTLAMDMLGELKRCPKELYSILDDEHSAKFRAKFETSGENGQDDDENDYLTENLFLRYDSRFSQLALSFIDSFNILPGFVFHIDLGYYYFRFYPKNGVDGITRQRNLKKHLLSSGNLAESIALKKTNWRDFEKENHEIPKDNQEPYVTNTYPHYHINNNQIGLFKNGLKSLLPELIGSKPNTIAPDYWLSVFELPALIFYGLLCKQKAAISPAQIIANHVERVSRLFTDIQNRICLPIGFGVDEAEYIRQIEANYVDFANIPKPLADYLLGRSFPDDSFNTYAAKKIEVLRKDTQHRLKQLNNNGIGDDKQAKSEASILAFDNLKAGRLAAFLAADMIMMQPSVAITDQGLSNGKDKVTGMNYQVLQSCLALFAENKHKLHHIFENCKLINSDIPHPFLKNIDLRNVHSISTFYLLYLNERLRYLGICKLDKDFKHYYFLKPGQRRWQQRNADYYCQLASTYLNGNSTHAGSKPNKLPLNLPRNLFTQAIKDWVGRFGTPQMQQLIKTTDRINASFLLTKYFELCLDDSNQPFYNFPRSYSFTDKYYALNEKPVWRDEFKTVYIPGSELLTQSNNFKTFLDNIRELHLLEKKQQDAVLRDYSRFQKNEKLIRLAKTTDMALFMMAKYILEQKKLASTNEFKLSAIQTPDVDDILSKQFAFQYKIVVYPSNEKGAVLYKELPLCSKTITQTDLKYKNFGDFMRFKSDRRLNELLQYIKGDTVSRSVLQRELDDYDTQRLLVSKCVHKFEERMKIKFGNALSSKLKEKNHVEFKEISALFYSQFPQYQEQCIQLERIRNAFMHNQYPRPQDVTLNLTLDEYCLHGVAKSLGNRAEQLVCTFIDLLNSLTTKR